MRGVQSVETVVGAPAAAVWECYRALEVAKLSGELLSDILEKVEVVEGDGGVGTILKITFPPGTGVGYWKEKFTMMDDDRRVKETEVIEDGLQAIGFDLYRFRIEVIEKDVESSIIKSSIEYEFDDSKAELIDFVSTKTLERMAWQRNLEVMLSRRNPLLIRICVTFMHVNLQFL